MENYEEVVGYIGIVTGLFLFLSPVPTLMRMVKNNSLEKISVIPIATVWLGCTCFGWYTLLPISDGNPQVLMANAFGIIISSVCFILSIILSPMKEMNSHVRVAIVVEGSFIAFLVSSIYFFNGHDRRLFSGVGAAISYIIMYGSHFESIISVKKTKSLESMPFFASLFRFLYAMSWFTFGLLRNDLFVAIPNGIGCVVGAVALLMYAWYSTKHIQSNDNDKRKAEMGDKKRKSKKKTN